MGSLLDVVHNTTDHSTTGYTPFELILEQTSGLPSALKSDPSPQCNYDDYVSMLRGRLQTPHHSGKDNLKTSKNRSKDYYNQKTEMMELDRRHVAKVSCQWRGPYEVMEGNKVKATIKRRLR
jgi:hypothetical protein